MKKRAQICIAAGLLLVIACFCLVSFFCLNTEPPENKTAEEKIVITDALGRVVTLERPAQRIACTHYSVSEAVQLAGAWDKVVARDGYLSNEKFYPGVDKLPIICPARNPLDINYEEVVKIHPDVLILPNFSWLGDPDEITGKLEPDVPVVFVDTLNPETFCNTIDILGKIAGTEKEAGEYIDFYRSIYCPVTNITSNIPGENRPNVFFKAFSDEIDDIKTYGSEFPGGNEFFNAAGVRNIAEDLPINCADVDKEWLIGQDIDAIAAICWDKKYPDTFGYNVSDPSFARTRAEEIRTQIGGLDVFLNSKAVENNEIYLLNNEMTSTPRYIITIAYMAKWFHPDLFEDLDPKALHQEYLDRFIPGDYNLTNCGLMIYPE
ncbi:iron complex transport system substrate-binding protein [Methanomicrobium sp. W14]|uniref:ABC transporter substrate-binding protein n=1 Tax=Methanomicrobium sp. W14 TaxID=2817839 RepID=UPI001AE80826|nr:ABC transporter substrate-binding protein [Methanomicrobium sp. W14]MBP2133068.1 iron complex transport system substrate-binding protein [Methanomicrobium sp. W14]